MEKYKQLCKKGAVSVVFLWGNNKISYHFLLNFTKKKFRIEVIMSHIINSNYSYKMFIYLYLTSANKDITF